MLILKDRHLLIIFCLSFAVLIISFLIALFKIGGVTSPLIIHFDAYKGINIFGDRIDIFGIFASAFAAESINLFLANFLYNRERLLSYFFGFGSFGLSILILIAMGVIISVN